MSKEVDSSIMQIYEMKKLLGSGAYGFVWKVCDRQTRKEYALKKIFDAFHNDVDAQRTYRQITVLHELDHYNIIKLHKVHKAKNNRDLYLVFQYMETDLQSLVGEEVLQDVHLRFVVFQILRGLKYLHSAQLIHRDLKPSNVLINSDCEIKLCDFGLVRSLTHEQDQPMILSQEVATRWYRSPEMLLGSKSYGKETDVWSVGCIVAELIIGQPIFPGDSTLNQLQRILQFTGVPSTHNINSLQSEVAQNLINQLTINRKSYHEQFKKANKELVNLVTHMLEFNPKKRITVDEALGSPIFAEFRITGLQTDICTKFIIPQLDDNVRLSVLQYRKMIYLDIDRRYPEESQNYHLMSQKSAQKENKRVMRSHHSLNRKKSTQNIKVLNSSLHASHSHKKQIPSTSLYQTDSQKINKLKKQWKKNSLINPQGTIITQHGSPNQGTFATNKVQSYYKIKQVKNYNVGNEAKNKTGSSLLTKVRSRKILYKQKSKEKLENGRPVMGMQKKKFLRS